MRRPYRTYGISRMGRRRSYTPMCETHNVALKLGTCPECAKIKEAARQAAIKAMPDVREYVNWNKETKFWSPSFSPLYMVLLDKQPEAIYPDGTKRIFNFGSSSLCGSHGRTIEEVRKHAADMIKNFPHFDWANITIKIVNAPCVWDASIIHEVIEVVEVPSAS